MRGEKQGCRGRVGGCKEGKGREGALHYSSVYVEFLLALVS